MMMRTAASCVVILLAAGCATTTPTQYYTLDMQARAEADPQVNLVLDRLTLAESIADGRLPIQTSPTEMTYYASAHWINSVDELVAEKLEAELGPVVPGRRTLDMTGHLHAFQQNDIAGDGAEAYVKLALEFREAGASRYSDPLLDKVYEHRAPAMTADANAVVLALSQCIEAIAAEIAEDTAAL
jgi:uncharacterized lipoprotein YmbA